MIVQNGGQPTFIVRAQFARYALTQPEAMEGGRFNATEIHCTEYFPGTHGCTSQESCFCCHRPPNHPTFCHHGCCLHLIVLSPSTGVTMVASAAWQLPLTRCLLASALLKHCSSTDCTPCMSPGRLDVWFLPSPQLLCPALQHITLYTSHYTSNFNPRFATLRSLCPGCPLPMLISDL